MKKLITILFISLFLTNFNISSAQSFNEFEENFYTSDNFSAIEKAYPYKNSKSNNNMLVDKVVQMYLTRESLESTVKKMKEGYSLNDLIYNTKDYILPVVDLEGNLIETQIYRRLPSINDLDSETKAEVLNDKELLNYYTENENELVFAYSYNDGSFADGSVLNADTIIELINQEASEFLNAKFIYFPEIKLTGILLYFVESEYFITYSNNEIMKKNVPYTINELGTLIINNVDFSDIADNDGEFSIKSNSRNSYIPIIIAICITFMAGLTVCFMIKKYSKPKKG